MSSAPLPPGPDAAYHAALAAGEFRLQRCDDCEAFTFPPKLICPSCGSRGMIFRPVSGQASLYAFTLVNRAPDRGGPYHVALVDLAEGPRLMSRVEGCAAEALVIGMPLTLRLGESNGQPVPVFMPAEESA